MTASPAALVEWRNRVRAEYRSAAIAAQLVHQLIQAGAPDELLTVGLRIVRDELDHARLSHECLVALGGVDDPVALHPSELAIPPRPEGLVASLAEAIGREFCLGETFAVPLFAEMRARATDEAARPVLDRILRDEAIHRQFGWDALDAILELDPSARDHVAARLPEWIARFKEAYAPEADGPPIDAGDAAVGLLPLARYRALFFETLAEDIAPRFARRGIAV